VTEIQHDPPGRKPIPASSHLHGVAGSWLTVSGRIYSCGCVVAEMGHLDATSHRMVWELATEQEFHHPSTSDLLTLMGRVLEEKIDMLQTPPW
jgi:hypothetical protein